MAVEKTNICLIATEIGLLDNDEAIAHIEKEGAVYHSATYRNGNLKIDERDIEYYKKGDQFCQKSKTTPLSDLNDGKVHFVHIGKLTTEQISEFTRNGNFQGLIVGPEAVPADAKVEYMGRIGSGVNNLPIKTKEEAGEKFVATNSPGSNAPGTAFHTVRAFLQLSGCNLVGKKVTIMGAGHIGTTTANILKAMGADVTIWNRSPIDGGMRLDGVNYLIGDENKIAALKHAEYISLHIPLNDKTKGFIGKKEIEAMPKGVKIINFARPGLVNAGALRESIQNKKVSGVAIDGDYFKDETKADSVLAPFVSTYKYFYEYLDSNPNREQARESKNNLKNNFLLLPHIGGDTVHQDRERGAITQIDQFIAFARDNKVHNLQSSQDNLPEGTEVVPVEKSKPMQIGEPLIKKLDTEQQKKMLEAIRDLMDADQTALIELSKDVTSGQRRTDYLRDLYCEDLSGREIELPKGIDQAVAAQIIGSMSGKVKERAPDVSLDESSRTRAIEDELEVGCR